MDLKVFLRSQLIQRLIVSEATASGYAALFNINLEENIKIHFLRLWGIIALAPMDFIIIISENVLHVQSITWLYVCELEKCNICAWVCYNWEFERQLYQNICICRNAKNIILPNMTEV